MKCIEEGKGLLKSGNTALKDRKETIEGRNDAEESTKGTVKKQ
jgi:hypothetical protein